MSERGLPAALSQRSFRGRIPRFCAPAVELYLWKTGEEGRFLSAPGLYRYLLLSTVLYLMLPRTEKRCAGQFVFLVEKQKIEFITVLHVV